MAMIHQGLFIVGGARASKPATAKCYAAISTQALRSAFSLHPKDLARSFAAKLAYLFRLDRLTLCAGIRYVTRSHALPR